MSPRDAFLDGHDQQALDLNPNTAHFNDSLEMSFDQVLIDAKKSDESAWGKWVAMANGCCVAAHTH